MSTLTLENYKQIKEALSAFNLNSIKTEYTPKFNKIYIQALSERMASHLLCEVLNDVDTRRVEICRDWSESVNHYDDFLTWVNSDDVIKLKDKYTCQCIQYKKQFTLDDLYIYYLKEYADI